MEQQKNKKKKKDPSFSDSSDSSVEIVSESEGEGDNWDHPLSDTSDENIQDIGITKADLKKDDFVIIIYDTKFYPGQIKQINSREKTFLVSSMVQSGLNFKWPEKEDILWYSLDQVVSKIEKPRQINSRGSFHVPEMSAYMN